jgi:hypothetical protein
VANSSLTALYLEECFVPVAACRTIVALDILRAPPPLDALPVYLALSSPNPALRRLELLLPGAAPLPPLLSCLAHMAGGLEILRLSLPLLLEEPGGARDWGPGDSAGLFSAVAAHPHLTSLGLCFRAGPGRCDEGDARPRSQGSGQTASSCLGPAFLAGLLDTLAFLPVLANLELGVGCEVCTGLLGGDGAEELGRRIVGGALPALAHVELDGVLFDLRQIIAHPAPELARRGGFSCEGDECAALLASLLRGNLSLAALDLRGNHLQGGPGLRVLAALAGATRPALKALGLRCVGLGEQGAAGLAAVLVAQPQVESLDLRGNLLRDGGVSLIAPALTGLTCLASLDLGDNFMGPAGVALVAGAVASPALVRLSLCNSHAHPGPALAAVAALVARSPALEELDLADAELGVGLEFDDGDESVAALCDALAGLCGLRRLLLARNRLVGRDQAQAGGADEGDDRYLEPLAAVVRASAGLRELDLSGNHLGPATGRLLAAAAAGIFGAELRLGNTERLALSVSALRAGPGLDLESPSTCELAAAAELAAGCTRLESVAINRYGGKGGASVSELLRPALSGVGANLTRLRLRSVSLLGREVEQLADALRGAAGLVELALPWNPFGARGAAAVARAVQSCGALASLDLSMCALAGLCQMDGCVFAVQKTLLPSFHPMPTLRSALPPKPAALASPRLICSTKTCCKAPSSLSCPTTQLDHFTGRLVHGSTASPPPSPPPWCQLSWVLAPK